MLPSSLAKLGKDFNVATLKTEFPYKFAIQGNLFYQGSMPNINYYDNLTEFEYTEKYMNFWSFEQETIRYLNNDLCSLFDILVAANKRVFRDYNVNLRESITISGLALKIYLKDFYKNNIPNINKRSVYQDIKNAYYGGITEVYKPKGNDLYYYDVNSLYPFAALNDMPGLICDKITFYSDSPEVDTLFGFFYCRSQTPLNDYLGLLPLRGDNGLSFPLGKWEGWYFSE